MRRASAFVRSGPGRWLIGSALAVGIAAGGRQAGALGDGGAAGAIFVGGTIFGRGGKRLALPLIGFFVSSSLLSKLGKSRQPEMEAIAVKGGQRDLLQVLANGGIPAVLALAGGRFIPAPMANAAYTGALAAVTADTWSTEIGGLSRIAPRSILSGKPVPPGLSGGVTPLGLIGAAVGGMTIGLLSWRGEPAAPANFARSVMRSISRIAAIGLAGSLIDSLLGASLQQIYYCPNCDMLTERAVHSCGTHTTPHHGYAWMTNDMVNFLTSVSGAAIGAAWFNAGSEE